MIVLRILVHILIVNFILLTNDFIFSHAMESLRLIRKIMFYFSTTDSLMMLYLALVCSKLDYTSVACNSVTITDFYKLERIQRKFAALCQNMIFHDVEYLYNNLLEKLNLPTMHFRRRHSDAFSFINIISGVKCCPSLLETVGIRVPPRNINIVSLPCSVGHSARSASAANAISNLQMFLEIHV
jgi:hypothetical protein